MICCRGWRGSKGCGYEWNFGLCCGSGYKGNFGCGWGAWVGGSKQVVVESSPFGKVHYKGKGSIGTVTRAHFTGTSVYTLEPENVLGFGVGVKERADGVVDRGGRHVLLFVSDGKKGGGDD